MGKMRIPAKLREALKRKYTQPIRVRAVLGKADGTITGDQENFVWVTDANDDETQVFNDAIPANKYGYGLPVWIERIENSSFWRIASIRQIYGSTPVAVGIKEHASTHTAYGNDPVWVWSDQFMPWLVVPSGLTLKVYRMSFYNGMAWEDALTETLDLTSHKPASGARYVLVEVVPDGDLIVTDGTVIAGSKFSLKIADIPVPTIGRQALCGVRLYAGQTVIAKNGVNRDIYDLRFSRVFGGGAGAGIPDAPSDDVYYGRLNAAWSAVPRLGHTHSQDSVPPDGGPVSHTHLSNIGSYTHPVIDTFIANDYTRRTDTKEPNGWLNGAAIAVSYDGTTRQITLTGTLQYYYLGVKYTLTSPWVSDAHANTAGVWYLANTGGGFVWSTTPWTFDAVMVAFVNFGASNKYAICETHGLMNWESHREFHNTIGTYRSAGGVLGSYVLASTTAGDRRPTVTAATLEDEDNQTVNPALTSDLYTQIYYPQDDATNTLSYAVDAAEIVPVLAANPYYNYWDGAKWNQTLMANNSYASVWLIAMPVADDAASQKYRYLWLQGQSNGALAAQQALLPADLNLGNLTVESPEFVFLAKIIVRFTGGNWVFTSVTNLLGNKFSQVGSPAGAFLSLVTTDATLTGDGTATNPLGVTASTYQPLDADLTAIAALAPTNDDIIQRKAGAWINRTMAQLAADLANLFTYEFPFASYISPLPLTVNGNPYLMTVGKPFTATSFACSTYVLTTNNGSNYWTLTVKDLAGNTICSVNTSALAASTWVRQTTTSFTATDISAARIGVYVEATKTGAPGSLYLGEPKLMGVYV